MTSDNGHARDLSAHPFSVYLWLRTISAVGDEVWNTGLPIYAASIGWSSAQLGSILSFSSLFSVIAYLSAPTIMLGRQSLSKTAAVFDFLQFALFGFFSCVLQLHGSQSHYGAVMVLACGASFLTGLWYVGSEALLPRLRDIGTAQDVQKRSFLSWTIGASVGPAIAAFTLQALGVSLLLVANALSFLGQSYSLWRLRSYEFTPKVATIKSFNRHFSALTGIFNSRFIVTSSAFSVFVRIFTMGFMPFVIFHFKEIGLSTEWLSALAIASPGAMLIAVKLYKPRFGSALVQSFVLTSFVFTLSGFALVWSTLEGFSQNVAIVLLAIFGAAIGIYTVQVRAIRQMVTPPENLAGVVASQTLWSRCAAPLSGILFGYVLSNLPTLSNVIGLCCLGLGSAGLLLAAAQGLSLKETA